MHIHWFRRDLRLHDNAALYHALKSGTQVLGIFIFDPLILDKLADRSDARVTFIHKALADLRAALAAHGSSLLVLHNEPILAWKKILTEYKSITKVFANKDYEPYAISRDAVINELLAAHGIGFEQYKDHVILEHGEVLKDDGKPYTVFTPYSRKWRAKCTDFYLKSYPNEKYFGNFYATPPLPYPSLAELGFGESPLPFPPTTVAQSVIKNYTAQRDYPAVDGTSHLGIHFRFGTVSIREKARKAQALNETFLNELIWRDFYSTILAAFPQVVGAPFSAKYAQIEWRDAPEEFAQWCAGNTGYPLVDAGMRELNATGYMHNRVRMVVASFLTKHLLISWQWGEAYFAEKLLDFDLASNNGGWQWAAGCGTDAAPYFRVFNPTAQQAKFDKDSVYIKKWVPEFGTDRYPAPMVEHSFARTRCLATYKKGLDNV